MASPANYQRSGTEGIRSNERTLRSTDLNPGLTGSGTGVGGTSPGTATTKRSSTLNPGLAAAGAKSGGLSVYDATVKASTLLKQGNGGTRDVWPAKVDSFADARVK